MRAPKAFRAGLEPRKRNSCPIDYDAGTEWHRFEQMLAWIRVLASACCVLVAALDRTGSGFARNGVRLLVCSYAMYSILAAFWLNRKAAQGAARTLLLTADAAVVATVFALTGGISTTSYVLLLYILVAAPAHGGVTGFLVTIPAAAALVSAVIHPSTPDRWAEGLISLAPSGRDIGFSLATGILMGMFSRRLRRLGAEKALYERLFRVIHEDYHETVRLLCEEMRLGFGARGVLIAAREDGNDSALVWQTSGKPGAGFAELGNYSAGMYFFPGVGAGSYRRKRFSAARPDDTPDLPAPFISGHSFQHVLFATSKVSQWNMRAFVFDPSSDLSGHSGLGFLTRLVTGISPAVYSLYLLRDSNPVKSAGFERARIGCELHDGPIQFMSTLDLRLEVFRRNLAQPPRDFDRQLESLQKELREQIGHLRQIILGSRSLRRDREDTASFLGEIAATFQKNSRIPTTFISDTKGIDLPGRVRFEMARILQEALTNVGNHSKANRVEVIFEARQDSSRLIVSDNGLGLPLKGRFTRKELEARGIGPVVIQQRVRMAGGELSIESMPDRGMRMEVTIPFKPRGESGAANRNPVGRESDNISYGPEKTARAGT